MYNGLLKNCITTAGFNDHLVIVHHFTKYAETLPGKGGQAIAEATIKQLLSH